MHLTIILFYYVKASVRLTTQYAGDQIKKEEMGGAYGMLGIYVRRETHAGFWWRNPRMRSHLEDQGVDLEDNIKIIFKKQDGDGGRGMMT